jgi:hypothetical protein
MIYSATSILVAAALFDASLCEGYLCNLPVSFVRNVHHAARNASPADSIMTSSFTSLSSPSTTVSAFATRYPQQQHPEFSVVDESEEGNEGVNIVGTDSADDDEGIGKVDFRQRTPSSDLLIVKEDALSREARSAPNGPESNPNHGNRGTRRQEYAALQPGTVVQVQVGDLALARKAWKKRRRTGSPLLVPCSVLSVDRQSMVRWNMIFLLEKFGQPVKDGMELSLASLARWHRTYLKSSLHGQATALGYDTNEDMLNALFNKRVQDSYGVHLEVRETEQIEGASGTMHYLKAPLSRRKGHLRTANTPLLQFRLPIEGDHEFVASRDEGVIGDTQGSDKLTHTGRVRVLNESSEEREYKQYPLSAALRVSQKDDVDTGRVSDGSIHSAVIFDYDKIGDGGSPLLTLSLNPGRVRETLKIKSDRKYEIYEKPTRLLKDLSVGDGPFKAKVVKLLGGKALVDLGVGRHVAIVGTTVKVLGALTYMDSVELASDRAAMEAAQASASGPWVEFDDEDDEDIDDLIEASIDELDMLDNDDEDEDDEDDEQVADALLALRKDSSFDEGTFEEGEVEEDLSHLYKVDENGQLVYSDPDTGSVSIVDEADMDFDDDNDEDFVIVPDGSSVDIDDEDDAGEVVNDDGSYDDDGDEGVGPQENFDDENDDISDEVIASLFSTNNDGSLSYHDPETGETLTVNSNDELFDDMMLMKSLIEDDLPSGVKSEPTSDRGQSPSAATMTSSVPETQVPSSRKPRLVSKRLHVGDEIDVYVTGVSKQSNRLTVTTNPLAQGRKAKDLRNEKFAQKKRDRLKKQLGGSLHEIYKMNGRECNGTVKATSKAGDWLYVQPDLDGLPVGVATSEDGQCEGISVGEKVRVRIAGVDEKRGQLAMRIIGKLAP